MLKFEYCALRDLLVTVNTTVHWDRQICC